MHENYKSVNAQVDIENIATYLLGKPIRGMYRYPNERTPSIKVYPGTQSFFDFGRSTGGDSVKLWSHIRHCNSWTALSEIAALYGIPTALSQADRKSIAERIKTQERAQKERERTEKRKRKQWIKEVERLQEWRKLCQDLLDSGHLPPFCAVRSWCYSEIQMADYKLDILCGIEE